MLVSQLQTHPSAICPVMLGLDPCTPQFSFASWFHVSLCQHGNKKNIAELEEKQAYTSLLASFSLNIHLFIQLLNKDLSDYCMPSTVLGV